MNALRRWLRSLLGSEPDSHQDYQQASWSEADRRAGSDRRSGDERRAGFVDAPRGEDRRSGDDRRSGGDRRDER